MVKATKYSQGSYEDIRIKNYLIPKHLQNIGLQKVIVNENVDYFGPD